MNTKPNELKIVRTYDAPVRLVWEAWTDPARAALWWGPRGFTLTTHSKDLRPGGHWAYTMHGPDGVDYENKAIYHEVEEHAKLVYDHGGNDDRPPLFRVTVHFREKDGKTTMEMTMALATAEAARETKAFIRRAGGNATWDRLAEYLEKGASGREIFVIHRSFDASRSRVFALWTDPTHLARWLPPQGFRMEVLRADVREGGVLVFRMIGEEITLHARFTYESIEVPRRIVYLQEFCDEGGHPCPHPLAPDLPVRLRTTVDFFDEGKDAVRLRLTTEVADEPTASERDAFVALRSSMTPGWNTSFDALEELLPASAPE